MTKPTIEEQLRNFLSISLTKINNNEWLQDNKMQVYVRSCKRYINREIYSSLDIANILVYPKYQHQGYFTRFLDYAIKIDNHDLIFIENVFNPFLGVFLQEQKGFTPYLAGECNPISYYRFNFALKRVLE